MRTVETVLTLSSLLYLSKCQTISLSTGQSKNKYLHTAISWGTSPQTLNVLVDTTDSTSWVYNQSVDTNQKKFNAAESSTFTLSSDSESFSYQDETTTIQFATDNFSINSQSLPNIKFAVAKENFTITDSEGLSGFFSLNRLNEITSGLHEKGYIENETISIDITNNKLYLGPYSPSSSNINNVSNKTSCSQTSNEYLNNDWTFDITVSIDGIPALGTSSFKGVIDSASPYITIYATSENAFIQLWILIDGSKNADAMHCNYTTRYCAHTDVMNYMTIFMEDSGWNLTFFQSDIMNSSQYIQFLYDPDTSFTTDADFVLFLGRPFLTHTVVTMDYTDNSMTFYATKTSTSSLDWVTIVIVFGCVIAFAAIFFVVYYWKYGKIAAPSNHDVEEQSLLRGPVQAVGTGQGAINQGVASAPFSGISGLDEDDDDYQHQLQQAQRQSAIEAQQRREQQMRIDREREMEQEQKQQSQLQSAQRQSAKVKHKIGSKKGDAKPESAEDLRQRRLKFLEQQQQQQENNNDD